MNALIVSYWSVPSTVTVVTFACLLLAPLARGVFGVARCFLITFEHCFGLRLRKTLGVLPFLFIRDSVCLPGFLRRAFCVSTFGGGPLRGFAFRPTDLANFLSCRAFSLSLG